MLFARHLHEPPSRTLEMDVDLSDALEAELEQQLADERAQMGA